MLQWISILLFFLQANADSCVKDIHSKYHEYTFEQLHTVYPIVTFVTDIIHAEDVKYLLRQEKKNKFVRSGLMYSSPSEVRTSSTMFLSKNTDPVLDCIGKRISTAIHQPFAHMESFQMTKYYENQHYKPHWDWFTRGDEPTQRTHTVFVYLKTAKCGGTTIFPHLNIDISAEPGSGLIWANLDYNGKGENLVQHGGTDVTCNDTKIGLNVWFQNTCWPQSNDCSIQPFKIEQNSCTAQNSYTSKDVQVGYDERINQNARDILELKRRLNMYEPDSPLKNEIQIISGSECNDFFNWQSAGLVYSWHASGASKTSQLTRVIACNHNNSRPFQNENIISYKSYSICEKCKSNKTSHSEIIKDAYPAYNKPGFVIEWVRHREKTGKDKNGKPVDGTKYVVIMDADMLIKRPIDPDEINVGKNKPVGAFYGYLEGCNNELIHRHLDKEFHKYCSKVGGISIWRYEDLRQILEPWLTYSVDVRHDPMSWKYSGDVYVKEGGKPWISEMYGYVFGAASKKMKIQENNDIMVYPMYSPKNPIVIHYGLEFKIGTHYIWNKHHFRENRLSPPKLFEIPPEPTNAEESIATETISTLNEAFTRYSN